MFLLVNILVFFLSCFAVKNLSTKHPLKSPSGVTPKSKKSLFCTPQKITTPKRPCFSQSQCRPQMVDACTQTKTFTTSTTSRKKFDVKVMQNTFESILIFYMSQQKQRSPFKTPFVACTLLWKTIEVSVGGKCKKKFIADSSID